MALLTKLVPVKPTLPTSRSNYFGVAWMAAARSLCRLLTSDCILLTSDSNALSLLLVVVLKVFRELIEAVFVATYVATALTVAVLAAV